MAKPNKIIDRRTLELQIPRERLEKAVREIFFLRDCNADDFREKIENANPIPPSQVPLIITKEFEGKEHVFYKKDNRGVFYVIQKTVKHQQGFFIKAYNPEIPNNDNRPPSTIRSFSLKERGLKCYSELEEGLPVCKAEQFKRTWEGEVENPNCIYQRKKGGKLLCVCGDVESEYDAEWFEANENARKKEAFDVYNWKK